MNVNVGKICLTIICVAASCYLFLLAVLPNPSSTFHNVKMDSSCGGVVAELGEPEFVVDVLEGHMRVLFFKNAYIGADDIPSNGEGVDSLRDVPDYYGSLQILCDCEGDVVAAAWVGESQIVRTSSGERRVKSLSDLAGESFVQRCLE